MKHPQIKHFCNKALPPALRISKREAAQNVQKSQE